MDSAMPRGHWEPLKPELEDQFEKQIQEFSLKENRSEKLSVEEWKNRYIFMEVQKIFFVSFAHELQEWLAQLVEFQTYWKDDQITQWTPELVRQLENDENTITMTVDHWVDSILGRFMTEFFVDQFVSYSEAEQRFFIGFRDKFLKTLLLLIKMLLRKKGILCGHNE